MFFYMYMPSIEISSVFGFFITFGILGYIAVRRVNLSTIMEDALYDSTRKNRNCHVAESRSWL